MSESRQEQVVGKQQIEAKEEEKGQEDLAAQKHSG